MKRYIPNDLFRVFFHIAIESKEIEVDDMFLCDISAYHQICSCRTQKEKTIELILYILVFIPDNGGWSSSALPIFHVIDWTVIIGFPLHTHTYI